MKRIVFINAHTTPLLVTTVAWYIWKMKIPCKYISLIKELVKNREIEIVNYVSRNGTGIIPPYIHLPFSHLLAKMENKYILKHNKLYDDIKTIYNWKKINNDDIVIGVIHSRYGCEDFEKVKGKKVQLLNQYYCHSLEELNKYYPYADAFIGEANIFKEGNYIMKVNLPLRYKFILTPFIVEERFKMLTVFSKRKNCALATGTIGPCLNPDYINHYQTNLIHKMRKVIYDNQDYYSGVMDVMISPYVENNNGWKKKESDNNFVKSIKTLFNLLLFGKKMGQKKYFSFDIVQKYNEYKMAVVPEEVCGVPGIGAFEAMACGCAFIGIDHSMYRDLGLVPNIHYIVYDGTKNGLKKIIEYYLSNQEELASIAEKGRAFVDSNCRCRAVCDKLTSQLKEL